MTKKNNYTTADLIGKSPKAMDKLLGLSAKASMQLLYSIAYDADMTIFYKVADIVETDDFLDPICAKAYKAICAAYKNTPQTYEELVALMDSAAAKQGLTNDEFRTAIGSGADPYNYLSHARDLIETAYPIRRALLMANSEMERGALDDLEDNYNRKISEIIAAAGHAIGKLASDVEPQSTRFLIYPYFPESEVVVLTAPSGSGKTNVSCEIAAALSTGRNIEGESGSREPITTLYISAEEDGSDISGRLRANRADTTKCAIIAKPDNPDFQMNLATRSGINTLQSIITHYGARFVVLDPYTSFIEGIDYNRGSILRPIMEHIRAIAKRTKSTILLMSHTNKREGAADTNNLSSGSGELLNVARSGLFIYDDKSTGEKHLIHTKHNKSEPGASLRFMLEDTSIEGYTNTFARVSWLGISPIDKTTLDLASVSKKRPMEIVASSESMEMLLMEAEKVCRRLEYEGKLPCILTKEEFLRISGNDEKAAVFGGYRNPGAAFRKIRPELHERGFDIVSKLENIVKDNGEKTTRRGFLITKSAQNTRQDGE